MDELMNVLAIRNLEIAEQQNRPNNQHNPRDPFIELNHVQFIKVFRLTKDLVLYLIECLEPYIRPALRITDFRHHYEGTYLQECLFSPEINRFSTML